MTFAERRRLELDYKEWLNRESIANRVEIEDCAFNVIGYLDSKGLINKMPKRKENNRMTQERANEIVRKVIYSRLDILSQMKNSEDAFHVGRIVGQMQVQLEIELSQEVEEGATDEGINRD